LRAVGAVVALTLVTVTISESIFWAQPEQAYGDPLGLLATFVAYGVVVVAVVGLLERVAPSTWLGVFVGGAVLGWIVEGIVVTTTYEALPLSISFTALAWHALISVAWAWVLLPRWLTWRVRGLARMIVCGGLWGAWGAWQAADSGEQASVASFAWYAGVAGAVLAACLVGWLRWRSGRLVGYVALVVALGLIGVVAVIRLVQIPWAALVLGPLLTIAVWTMRRLPREASIVISEPAPTTTAVVAGIGMMVITAIGAYALTRGTAVIDGYGPAVYIVTTGAGFVLLGRAVWLAARRSAVPIAPP
jgi:hypothetical protein